MGDDEFGKLIQKNCAEFENAVNKVAAAKTRRQQKRAKKREKFKSAEEAPPNDAQSVSSSDTPFISKRKAHRKDPEIDSESDTHLRSKTRAGLRQNDASLDVRRMRSPQRPTLDAPSSSSSSDSGSETSIDSLYEQIRAEASDAARRNAPQKSIELIGRSPRTKDRSASSKKTAMPTSQPATSSSKSLQKKPSDPTGKRQDEDPKPHKSGPSRPRISSEQPAKPAPTRRRGSSQSARQDAVDDATTASTIRRGSKVAEDLIARAEGPSTAGDKAQMNKPRQFMRKSAPNPGPIKMVNEPKVPLKSVWRKGGDEGLYTKVHWKRKAELRGRDEQTPDPSALSFVRPPPGGIPRPPARVNDNPYGRRDITTVRPAQDDDSDDSSTPQPAKALEWENDKVPLTCFDWRSNSCPYTAEQCKFLHRNTDKLSRWDGWVPPKYARPKITCSHWLRKMCYKTDDECVFAHWNTGWLAGNVKGQQPTQIDTKLEPSSSELPGNLQQPPLQHFKSSLGHDDLTCWYWLRGTGGCIKPDAQCVYSHRNTGWLLGQNGSGIIQIDPTEQPRSLRRRPDTQLTCYFWKNGRRCNKGDNCKFQHYDTGIVAESPHSIGGLGGCLPIHFKIWPINSLIQLQMQRLHIRTTTRRNLLLSLINHTVPRSYTQLDNFLKQPRDLATGMHTLQMKHQLF